MRGDARFKLMTLAQLTLSFRRRLFYSVLGGFAGIYLLAGSLDFVLACPIGAALSAALFLVFSPVKGKFRLKGALVSLLVILTFPIFMLMLRVGHLGLYEAASPLIPFPIRLVLLLLLPVAVVFTAGGWLARGHLAERPEA